MGLKVMRISAMQYLRFSKHEFVQLYVKHSRTIESASTTCAPKKKFNERLIFSKIDFVCHHGGKDYKTTSTGKRPNQK